MGKTFYNLYPRVCDPDNIWRAGEIETAQLHASVQGWLNHARYGDTYGLRRAVLAAADLSWE